MISIFIFTNIIHYSNQELYKIGVKYKTMTPFVTNSYNITDWAIKNWRSYPFQNKKYSLQKIFVQLLIS